MDLGVKCSHVSRTTCDNSHVAKGLSKEPLLGDLKYSTGGLVQKHSHSHRHLGHLRQGRVG